MHVIWKFLLENLVYLAERMAEGGPVRRRQA